MTPHITPSAYEELAALIVKAVPEIGHHKCRCCDKTECDYSTTGCPWYDTRPITLEDVLMTFHRKSKLVSPIVVDQYGGFWEQNYGGDELLAEGKKGWLLGKPLSEQSPETISFLLSLLRV